jgi:hypothetical protein
MTKVQLVTNLIYRLFLTSWLFAVLWMKGYLWCIFMLSALLILADRLFAMQLQAAKANRPQPAKSRAQPNGRRTKSKDEGGEPSWREPKPQWSPPPAKG